MKRLKNAAGTIFAVLIMILVLYLHGGDLKTVDVVHSGLLPKLAASVATYVAVMVLAAFGWRAVLRSFGVEPGLWAAERQMLISQIGKYVPGNVAQYVGRAAMAVNSGIAGKTVAIALIADTAAIVGGGLIAVTVPLALSPNSGSLIGIALPDRPQLLFIGLTMTVLFVVVLSLNLVPFLGRQLKQLPKIQPAWLILALLVYALSFLLLGLSLHFVAGSLSASPMPLWLSIEVFAAGWIAGLMTPGAPGGLGVRESVLTLGLAPVLGGAAALSAALLHRGVSVLGDVISFGLGHLLPKQGSTQPA
jgi:glycosyltransferase 2 family protein